VPPVVAAVPATSATAIAVRGRARPPADATDQPVTDADLAELLLRLAPSEQEARLALAAAVVDAVG
jgi:hypothetical protein